MITNNHRLNRKLFARLQNISNDILLLVIIIIITGIYFTVSPLNTALQPLFLTQTKSHLTEQTLNFPSLFTFGLSSSNQEVYLHQLCGGCGNPWHKPPGKCFAPTNSSHMLEAAKLQMEYFSKVVAEKFLK